MTSIPGWLQGLFGPTAVQLDGVELPNFVARATVDFVGEDGFTVSIEDDPDNDVTRFIFTPPSSAGVPGGASTELQYRSGATTFGAISTMLWNAASSRVRVSSSGMEIRNPLGTFGYILAGGALAADRTLSLPLLAGNDTIACEAHAATFTNKTMSWGSNTFTLTSAQLAAACSDETGSGALVFGTSPTLASPTLGGTPVFSATSVQATGNARCKLYSDIANVQTTDATVTSLYTWTILDEAVTGVTAEVLADQSTGANTAWYVRRARIKRDGGTVTVGTVEDSYTSEEVAGWDCTIDNSTSTGRIRVTGAAATTIDWGGVTSRIEVAHA